MSEDPLLALSRPKKILDWNKIVSSVVAFLITGLLLGFTGLIGWIAKGQVEHIRILTRIEAKQDADRKAQDKIVEFYAKDIVELRATSITLDERLTELESIVRPPAMADDDDDTDDDPPKVAKKPPMPLTKKEYEELLKGKISRVREMEQRTMNLPPQAEEDMP